MNTNKFDSKFPWTTKIDIDSPDFSSLIKRVSIYVSVTAMVGIVTTLFISYFNRVEIDIIRLSYVIFFVLVYLIGFAIYLQYKKTKDYYTMICLTYWFGGMLLVSLVFSILIPNKIDSDVSYTLFVTNLAFMLVMIFSGIEIAGSTEYNTARKNKKKIVDEFKAILSESKILYKKEFLILNREMPHSISFAGRYDMYKDFVIADDGVYIVGTPKLQHIKLSDILSLDKETGNNSYPKIKLLTKDQSFYIYINTLSDRIPVGSFIGLTRTFQWYDSLSEQIDQEYFKINSIIKGLK